MIARARRAKERMRADLSSLSNGYKYGLCDNGFSQLNQNAQRPIDVYDGTAVDAVEEWAARQAYNIGLAVGSMLRLVPGPSVAKEDRDSRELREALDETHQIIFGEIVRSNLLVEGYAALREAAVANGILIGHEGDDGQVVRWEAVPLWQVILDEGPKGRVDNIYREYENRLSILEGMWPNGTWSDQAKKAQAEDPDVVIQVIEGTEVKEAGVGQKHSYVYRVVEVETGHVVFEEESPSSRWIAFRSAKHTGATMGRGAVLRVLPDILTLNKLKELSLKNGAIAVAGIWQADDDGVLNPATIKLVPGAVIPKAVNSSGLQPLQPAASFQVSEAMINDLRSTVRRAIVGPGRPSPEQGIRSATEHIMYDKDLTILTMPENARLFDELIVQVYRRAAYLCEKKGKIGSVGFDTGHVRIEQVSPFTKMVERSESADRMQGLEMASAFGPVVVSSVLKTVEAARNTLREFGWSEDMLRDADEAQEHMKQTQAAMSQANAGGAPNGS